VSSDVLQHPAGAERTLGKGRGGGLLDRTRKCDLEQVRRPRHGFSLRRVGGSRRELGHT